MAKPRTNIMEIRQLIQLKIKDVSNRRCAQLLQINRNTINEYVRCLLAMEEGLEALVEFSDSQLRELFPQADTKDEARYKTLLAFLHNPIKLTPLFRFTLTLPFRSIDPPMLNEDVNNVPVH